MKFKCIIYFLFLLASFVTHGADTSPESVQGSLFNIESAPHGFVISFPAKPTVLSKRIIKDAAELEHWFDSLQNDIVELERAAKIEVAKRSQAAIEISEKLNKNNLTIDDLRAFHEKFIELTKTHPLMLCYECGSTESLCDCALARKSNVEECERAKFLKNLSAHLPNQSPQQGIIFYGPGGCMFELQATISFLRNGARFEHIYFIEPAWNLSFEIMKHFDRMYGQEKEINFGITDDSLLSAQRLVQVAHFVWALNPHIKFHVYNNQNGYRADLVKNPNLRADCLIAMDATDNPNNSTHVEAIEKELSALEGSLYHNSLVAKIYKSSLRQINNEVKLTNKKVCAHCQKSDTKLELCSACKSVSYCSKDCQRSHWRASHSKACMRIIQ